MLLRNFWVLLIALTACGPTTRTVIEQPAPIPAADTTLGVGDMFDVRVFGEPDLTQTFKVSAEGNINFPLAGTIRVQGLEPQQVADAIAKRLADGILRNPQVTVLVKDQTSKKVLINGQVSKPGVYTYTPGMSVVEAISLAGGFTPLAAKNSTKLTRQEGGQKTTIVVPVGDITQGRAKNVYLRPGDIIDVDERLF